RGVNADLRKDGDRITLAGKVDDPDWGQWTLSGGRDGANAPYQIKLHTDGLHATMDKMRRVPFVPPVVWEQIQFEGDSPVDLALQFGGSSAGPSLHYRVDLAPRDVAVHISAADLKAEHTRGKVRVEDGVVTLTGIQSQAAGGDLHTDA